jgi:hypothetical protein
MYPLASNTTSREQSPKEMESSEQQDTSQAGRAWIMVKEVQGFVTRAEEVQGSQE